MSLTWTNVSNIILVALYCITELLLYLPARSSSPLPDFVPNTHPEEPSYPLLTNPEGGGDSSKHLKGQVTPSVVSRPSTPPQELDDNEGAPPARKVSHYVISHLFNLHVDFFFGSNAQLLKRRAKVPPPSIIGIDDPSVIDAVPDIISTAAPATSSDAKNPSVLEGLNVSRSFSMHLVFK
jgi:hypothetical protein